MSDTLERLKLARTATGCYQSMGCKFEQLIDDAADEIDRLRTELSELRAKVEAHPDDIAVDKFAAAMKAKMAKQRTKGYSGWDDESLCPVERLQSMLVEHVAKGDPVDVGNFAMMLFNRDARTVMPQQAASVPDGWKLVPAEPTDEMVQAARENGAEGVSEEIKSDYRAFLSAAPEAPKS